MANDWAVRQGILNVDTLGDTQSILEFDSKITYRTIHLGVTEEELDSP